MSDEERLARRSAPPTPRWTAHPCAGRTDVSAATCWGFDQDWKARSGAAGIQRTRGLTYGQAFLDFYLPDVEDDELAMADDARAYEIIRARYST